MKEQEPYFEKQPFFSLQCGLYSVNHLLGKKLYSESSMKEICYELSQQFINPHKHPIGGDYDVNVLMIALSRQGLNTHWFDRRRLPLKLQNNQKEKQQLVGLLVNVHSQSSGILHKIFRVSSRHWFAVRKANQHFYWLDSKEEIPKLYAREELEKELNSLMQQQNTTQERPQILLVFRAIK